MSSRYDPTVLKLLRETLQWSVQELLEKAKPFGLNVSEGTINNWESGDTTPDANKLDLLAAVFGVGIERFYPTTAK